MRNINHAELGCAAPKGRFPFLGRWLNGTTLSRDVRIFWARGRRHGAAFRYRIRVPAISTKNASALSIINLSPRMMDLRSKVLVSYTRNTMKRMRRQSGWLNENSHRNYGIEADRVPL